MRRSRSLALAAAAAAALAAGAGIAVAAGVGVSAARLTSEAGGTSVPSTQCTVPASADSWVDENQPGANFATAAQLRVRSYDTTLLILLGEPQNARTLTRFDLAACAIPPNAVVDSARLRLRLEQAPDASRTYAGRRVVDDWAESTVTWSTQPGVDTTAMPPTVTTGTASGTTLEWDVTADAQNFVSGTAPNYGWRIQDTAEGSSTLHEGRLASREATTAADRPELVVSYWP